MKMPTNGIHVKTGVDIDQNPAQNAANSQRREFEKGVASSIEHLENVREPDASKQQSRSAGKAAVIVPKEPSSTERLGNCLASSRQRIQKIVPSTNGDISNHSGSNDVVASSKIDNRSNDQENTASSPSTQRTRLSDAYKSHGSTEKLNGCKSSERLHSVECELLCDQKLAEKITECMEGLECTSLTHNVCAMNCAEQVEGSSKKRLLFCGTVGQVATGTILVLFSLLSFIFTPLDLMLWEKLNMRPGLPPYDWWADPPDEVILSVYVFNVTNHERFLAGEDDKLNLQEIGPIVYLEKLLHTNVYFNDNSTMTYTANRTTIYLPERNDINLDQTMIVPNIAVLGLASYLHNAPYFVKAAYRFIVQSHQSEFFRRVTIQEYLWNFQDPVLSTSKNLAPGLIPVNNMGMLARMYADFVDEVTVTIGSQWGHKKFFQLDRFRGEPMIPGYDPNTCPDRMFGSTEGVMYAQHLAKQDKLLYWRKSVCKLVPLYFDTELTMEDIPVYRYNLSEEAFDRVRNGTDCYDTEPSLPDGISDASRCFFDFPMVVSYPHFYAGAPEKDRYVTGLRPDRYKHNSYVVVEPMTGIPLHSVARLQSNIRVHDLAGFGSKYARFSDLVLPMFWAEYNQEGLPDYISKVIYMTVVILPPLQMCMSAAILIVGSFLLAKVTYLKKLQNKSLATLLPFRRKERVLGRNGILKLEKDAFLNTYK